MEFNPAAERIFGYARGEVIGRPMAELIIPHRLRARHHAGLAHYLATGEGPVLNRQIEVLALRADGTEFPVELAIIPVSGTQPPLFTAFLRDITERKRAEEAMARLAALVESSDDGLFGQDLNGIITSWNRGAEQIFGYRTDEIVGTPITRLIPAEAEVQAEERELQRKIAAGERVGNFETMRQAKDGRKFPVSITVSPLKDEDGKVIGASKVVRDISKRAQAEAALRESEQRMRLATEATQVGLWEWNVLTGAIRWDAQLFRIYGIEPTPVGMVDYSDWSGAVLPEDLEENERILQDTVQQAGRSVRRFRIRRRSDGACRHIEAVETARANAQGQTQWIVGTNLDITARMEAEFALRTAKEAAENANQSKDRSLAVLSHELRTPLTPALAAASNLENATDIDPQELRESLSLIRRNIELEARLVDDLLDITRISKGKLEVHLSTIDLHETIQHAAEMCRSSANNKRSEIALHLDATERYVKGDGARLAQIFWDLILNAVKFTPADGSIIVRTVNPTPGSVRIDVTDNGIGIDPEMLSRIFEPFQQGEDSRRDASVVWVWA